MESNNTNVVEAVLADDPCDDVCKVEINISEIEKVYGSLSTLVYTDMDKQYKEGKFNGATYADTWAKLMSSVISGALQAVVSLQNKETAADRALKYANVDNTEGKTENEACLAESQCALNAAKTKAEDIKNGDAPDGTSIYGYNKEVLQAQDNLYVRQRMGFDDNARQKIMDSQFSTYSILFQDLGLDSETMPPLFDSESLQSTFNDTSGSIGMPEVPDN